MQFTDCDFGKLLFVPQNTYLLGIIGMFPPELFLSHEIRRNDLIFLDVIFNSLFTANNNSLHI